MHFSPVEGDPRLLAWQRVREFAVPPAMIKTATARRAAGDWAGACAAARVDVEVGRNLPAEIDADLRHLAPDLLRWHMPRVLPDGLLRPGLAITLARYEGGVHLVARTAPAWADAGQRITLTLWSGGGRHPHRRFRLDLHRHLWDSRHVAELRERHSGRRWSTEAAILREADGRAGETVLVRVKKGIFWALDPDGSPPRAVQDPPPGLPILPYAATWPLPDVELLRAGLIDPDQLHPLVAAALALTPNQRQKLPEGERTVLCGGVRHRLTMVGGVLTALDHNPDDLRREELLVALGGVPMPCLRAIDQAHRTPDGLDDIRGRLDHGDTEGALDAVEALLGGEAVLRDGALRDELEAAVDQQMIYGLYRAGLSGRCGLKSVVQLRGRRGSRRPQASKTVRLLEKRR